MTEEERDALVWYVLFALISVVLIVVGKAMAS